MTRTAAGFREFATGKSALAQCPRCGQVKPYLDLRADGQVPGLWVCSECWDPKHPQETPVLVRDAIALQHPRPITDDLGEEAVDLTDEDGFASTFGRADPSTLNSGVTFDGTTTTLTRNTDFAGNADSKLWSGSFWVKRNALGQHAIIENFSIRYLIDFLPGTLKHVLEFYGESSTAVTIFRVRGGRFDETQRWHHVAWSFDLSDAAKRHLYIDGSNVPLTVITYSNTAIDFTRNVQYFGHNASALKLNADLYDFWMAPGVYIDLSDVDNLQKFRSADGDPADLGSDGSTPTGTPPLIFLRVPPGGTASDFAVNAGTGGDYSVSGTLAEASSVPMGVVG